MSDSLGDGQGDPGPVQARLYERWAEGGVAASIIGEVQGDPFAAEKPGNLVLHDGSDGGKLGALTNRATQDGAHLWAQLGHAGAMAHPPISRPRGPSALNLPGLACEALSLSDIAALPTAFARTAARAVSAGFTGVQIHAAHGFLLSQFLSPLFNKRGDAYGGTLTNRMRLLMDVVSAVREAVGPDLPVALKLNATDQLQGGFAETEALEVIGALSGSGLDLIDISGGTYFPGAPSASDRTTPAPYFLAFAAVARQRTDVPLMITGGIKTKADAAQALAGGAVDAVGLARSLIIDPALPRTWRRGGNDPAFPRFSNPPEGGITAWYTMRLTALAEDNDAAAPLSMEEAVAAYDARDERRVSLWQQRFGGPD
ncbi:oxidoreductase [Jannaschia pagri]|uniref:Oxidoreductase n=2 Tax=Roseobacteraceae TaxID=2854170 RepID=A0ABQ4NMP1_9RHOB|nr:oxidoreductase [Jannaschia sp. AI_61]GIT95675.1 oxidoreductase [Jannaschia sp. AI_62]